MPEHPTSPRKRNQWPFAASLAVALTVGIFLAIRLAPTRSWWALAVAIPWTLALLLASGVTYLWGKSKRENKGPTAPTPQQSKLKIIFAEFRAFAEGGAEPNVTEVLKHRIVGDSLVFKVDRGDFKAPGLDPVSQDPFEGHIKRVEVTYSYQNRRPVTTEAMENDLLVLPEDILLEPLQRHALRLSVNLLQFLKELGPSPMPKYTEEQIRNMPDRERLKPEVFNDPDYIDACEFAYPDQGHEFIGTLKKWCDKVEEGYKLHHFSKRVDVLNSLFAMRGLKIQALSLPIRGRDAERNIRVIACSLWSSAYKIGDESSKV